MKKITFSMTIPLYCLDTLIGFIDGALGASDSEDFNEHMKPILKKLENVVAKQKRKNNDRH